MKLSRLYLSLAILLMGGITISAQEDQSIIWDHENVICKEQEHAALKIHQRGSRTVFADRTDIYYQVMKWDIDPAQYYITGEITYHFKSRVNNLTELHLDMANELQVNSISRNATPLSFTHTSDQLLTISLGKSLSSGEADSLTITYEGAPPSNGFGSFEQGTHAGQPIIWTLSEPYGVRDWWPGKQDLIDKIDSVDIYITTPTGQLAASNGKLMGITEINEKLTHHWRHRYPIASYLIAIAVTNYTAYSQYLPLDNGDSIEILNYVYPETATQSQAETERTIQIMANFNRLFGTYPFAAEKYGHAQFGWGGGMEHQTMSFMGGFSFGLVAHELAHQWFGDKVTCGSWTEIWLNEGFATYLTGLTYEDQSPDIYWPQWKTSTSNSAMSQPGGSVFVDDTTSTSRIFSGRLSYNKGAYLLHMLRWMMGDEAFFAACRDYLDSPGTAYDFAYTAELQAYLEQRSGKDLDEFFADWYYGQGYPSYNLTWSQEADSVVFWLNQTQSHPSVSFFEMPVPVSVILNGSPQTFVLDHTTQGQRFAFHVGNTVVENVSIDPELWLLSKNNTVNEGTTSTYQPIDQHSFHVFPNPAHSFIEIIPAKDVFAADFIDNLGRKWIASVTSGRIDITSLSSGFYTLMLKNTAGDLLSIQSIVVTR
ncbi:MAG TPA: M1 family aminopeptidase [Saprospiraceae bacterium]|nr:M1 family aminopeptidase [Saprospiraceae bacterium]